MPRSPAPPPQAVKRRAGLAVIGKSPRAPGSKPPASTDESLALPHERDQSAGAVAEKPDAVIRQAQRDLDAGQVDTDMRATPGLDAQRRLRLVPGRGGKPPGGGGG